MRIDYRAVADEAYAAALTATTDEERAHAARVESLARSGQVDLSDPLAVRLVRDARFQARVRADMTNGEQL